MLNFIVIEVIPIAIQDIIFSYCYYIQIYNPREIAFSLYQYYKDHSNSPIIFLIFFNIYNTYIDSKSNIKTTTINYQIQDLDLFYFTKKIKEIN